MTPCGLTTRCGFTLVEVLVVVVVLGILASITVPQFASATTDAKASSTAALIREVQQKIDLHEATTGDRPATIDPAWFTTGDLPRSPFRPDEATPIYYNTGTPASKVHPTDKTLANVALRGLWYNPASGRFRARVPVQATDAETLALYNQVHATRVADLGQITAY